MRRYLDREARYTREQRDARASSCRGCWVDASGPGADEGRGERRNVDGELHASAEPSGSEWGNPARREAGQPALNA